ASAGSWASRRPTSIRSPARSRRSTAHEHLPRPRNRAGHPAGDPPGRADPIGPAGAPAAGGRGQSRAARLRRLLRLGLALGRPRWFVRERLRTAIDQPTRGGTPPGALRKVGRALSLPWYSLWLNFKTGLAGLFCTYLLTGWGCLLMLFSWEFGWFNSINRYYEQSLIGPGSFFLGLLLFILAMFYVPMAQAHQAAPGQARALFALRFVSRLTQV